jgi:hypothetical protein
MMDRNDRERSDVDSQVAHFLIYMQVILELVFQVGPRLGFLPLLEQGFLAELEKPLLHHLDAPQGYVSLAHLLSQVQTLRNLDCCLVIVQNLQNMRSDRTDAFGIQSNHHLELADREEMIEAVRVPGGVLEFVAVLRKVMEDVDSRGVVEEGLKTFEDSCPRRLLDVAVEVGVGVQNESPDEVEEEGVIVELVVGGDVDVLKDENASQYHLSI